jgi:hypothetical protein
MELYFVGQIYHGRIIQEGKVVADDHFIVVDEYDRPLTPRVYSQRHCLLQNMRTGETHEVPGSRLRYGPHYKRVA